MSYQDRREDDEGKEERYDDSRRERKDESREEKEKRSIFVGNLQQSVNEEEIKKAFSKYGTIEEVRMVWRDKHEGIHKGCCFIQFEKEEEAQSAHDDKDGITLADTLLKVSMAGEKEKKNSIFVGNLSYNSTEDSIRQFFSTVGKVSKVFIPTDRDSGKMKGFCFIDFETTDDAKNALSLNEKDLDGRTIRVQEGGKGGSRGGGRGGRGGSRGGRRDYDRRDDRRDYDRRDERRRDYDRRDDRGRDYERRDDRRRDDRGRDYERRDDRRDDRRDERRERY